MRGPRVVVMAVLVAASLLMVDGLVYPCPTAIAAPERPQATSSAGAPAATSRTRPTSRQVGKARHGLVNTAHLQYLCEPVVIAGREMALVHIYADAPTWSWVDASGEGMACVDDAARAALVFLECHDRFGDRVALDEARRLLEFVMYMQTANGTWCNFVVDRRGTVNTTGLTSRSGWTWWSARGMWALARGLRTFEKQDAPFATRLRSHYRLAEDALARELARALQTCGKEGSRGLVREAGDLSAVVILALAEFQEHSPDLRTRAMLDHLASAVASLARGGPHEYPFGIHVHTLDIPGEWHLWGAHQVQALARAGAVLGRRDLVDSAAREAELFYGHMLASEMISHMRLLPSVDEQIAYGQSACVSGLVALSRATGDSRWSRLAGIAASWLLGNNRAGLPMYDAETGRGFDGLDGGEHPRVNRNSGAESTIEALWLLLQVSDDPVARRYLHATGVSGAADPPWRILDAEKGLVAHGTPRIVQTSEFEGTKSRGGQCLDLAPGDAVRLRFDVATAGDHYLYLAHQRRGRSSPRSALLLQIDHQDPIRLDESVPADGDHPWLDIVSPAPVRLLPGPHEIRIEALGPNPSRIDAVLVQPADERRCLRLPDGTRVTVRHSLRDGRTELIEERGSRP